MNDLFVMNMRRKCYLFVLVSCFVAGWAQHTWQTGPVIRTYSTGRFGVSSGFSAFVESHFIWCGSAIQAEEDGVLFILFRYGIRTEHPRFIDAWLLGSMIGVAVSDSPMGDIKDIGIVYNKDGYQPITVQGMHSRFIIP